MAGGWQRTQYAKSTNGRTDATFTVYDLGSGGLTPFNVTQRNNQYLNNWVFQGSLFIPVIPTATPNLAGTMSLMATAYLGEGLEFIGNSTGQNSLFRYISAPWTEVDRELQKVWSGNVQLQYYFSNEWFVNFVIGTGQNYGVDRSRDVFFTDAVKGWWEADLALYYRPIPALKFGLGYSYSRTDYFSKRPAGAHTLQTIAPTPNPTGVAGVTETGNNPRDYGDNHRLEFGAWFFF